MKLGVAFVCVLVACGGGAEDEPLEPETPAVCNPAPEGFIAWRSGELVMVSKKLTGTASGVQLRAEIRNVDGATLPAQVDFGAELIEVREDMSLCLVSEQPQPARL